jgi:release factor glutamine methyltransferase
VRLVGHVTGRSRSDVLLGFEVDAATVDRFDALVARRLGGEPLQYIEGSVPFGPVEIAVDERVLVPRPETEYLFELMVAATDAAAVIVDLCTGSGNLALALKAAFPAATVHATDLSADALDVARKNARQNELDVHFGHGDLFAALPNHLRGRVDLLVANPPYLAADELVDLPADVLREPQMALASGPDGDEAVRAIAAELGEWLRPGGHFGIEVSEFHAADVVGLFERFDAEVVKDLTGRDRYVVGSSRVR